MDRGAWQATVQRVAESDMTEVSEHTHAGFPFSSCLKEAAALLCSGSLRSDGRGSSSLQRVPTDGNTGPSPQELLSDVGEM